MPKLNLEKSADDLLAQWRNARGVDALPSSRFVDPLKLRQWVGDISVIHLHEGEKRFFVSLHGSNVMRHLGPDFHQRYLEDAILPIFHPDAFEPYEMSIKTKTPSYSIQRATLNNGLFKHLERMILPLHTGDPQKVGRFLVWVAPIASKGVRSSSVYRPFEDDEFASHGLQDPTTRNEMFLLSDRFRQREQAA